MPDRSLVMLTFLPLKLGATTQGLLSIWSGRQEAMAPSHRVHGSCRVMEDGKGRTQPWPREDEKTAAASTVVLFIRACLGLLSVAPVGASCY